MADTLVKRIYDKIVRPMVDIHWHNPFSDGNRELPRPSVMAEKTGYGFLAELPIVSDASSWHIQKFMECLICVHPESAPHVITKHDDGTYSCKPLVLDASCTDASGGPWYD